MTDKNDDVIEFIEDDEPTPGKPQKPGGQASQAPEQPVSFDPFSDVDVAPSELNVLPPTPKKKVAPADNAGPIDVFADQDVQVATSGGDAPAEPPPKSSGSIRS